MGNIYISDSYYGAGVSAHTQRHDFGVRGNWHAGDGGPATAAQLAGPAGLAVDLANNLYIADGNRIRKVTPAGVISTVASDLGGAVGIAVDAAGNLYISVTGVNVVRMVTPAGVTGSPRFSGDGARQHLPRCRPLSDSEWTPWAWF